MGLPGCVPPTPYTLRSTPFPHPAPYTIHSTPYTLHSTPYTLHPTPYTLLPIPCQAVATSRPSLPPAEYDLTEAGNDMVDTALGFLLYYSPA